MILTCELQTSMVHCHTFLLEVIALMEEVAEKVNSAVVDNAKPSDGMVSSSATRLQ